MILKNRITSLLVITTFVLTVIVLGLGALVLHSFGIALHSEQGLTTYLSLAVVIVTMGAASIITTTLALDRTLLEPLGHLSSAIRTIAATKNLSLRVPITYAPEVGEVVRSINAILDTTESAHLDMLRARFEVENANKGKSLFIAKVSHELRTPIHSITGMLRILLKQETAPGKRQYIQMAQDSAIALLETINEILDFSKMQNGELSLDRESFDLPQTIRSTIEHLIPRFEEKPDITLCWEVHPDVPETVTGDAARIRNILVNLLGNAFKFTDKGHVKLEVRRCASLHSTTAGIQFVVSDTGIGIPANKLTTIFDPFTTADEGTARLYAGTGLGLAIVKQIAERMSGSIVVHSTEGVGSTFAVELQLECENSGATIDTGRPENCSVAVLGSSDIHRETVAAGLERFGCNVTMFSLDEPEHLDQLISSPSSFEIIHIIKAREILNDELTPLLQSADREDIPVVLSVPAAEISSTDQLTRGGSLYITLQPTSALDLLLMTSGKLKPNTSIREVDEATEKATHKLNILIADDAKTNRIILKTLLEEAGHTVEVVENGKQLLDKIAFKAELQEAQALPYDLVLTDIQMPVMDGITATQNFRELERQSKVERKLPIVAVTSYAFPEECSKMLASGIDHILTKPINPKRLSRLISQITYDSDHLNTSAGGDQSDREIIEELCQLTENLSQRVSDLGAEISNISTPDAVGIIDIQGVFERSGDSLRRTGLILSGFIESYDEPLTVIEQLAMPVDDPVKFRRTVHSLKGLLLDAGAQIAADLAAILEDKAVHKPDNVTREEISNLAAATRDAAVVAKELVSALPSLEVYSALPSIDDEVTLH